MEVSFEWGCIMRCTHGGELWVGVHDNVFTFRRVWGAELGIVALHDLSQGSPFQNLCHKSAPMVFVLVIYLFTCSIFEIQITELRS